MLQKHRISTNIGRDQKVTVELKQEYDLLEILSLKFSQQQVYSSLCSDYGVVCGRISVNNGFGVPNAKVSIFVAQKDIHVDDPVISSLYPYTSVSDKNDENYRYNLLPSRKQHGGHVPTGTFYDQEDILTREEILEVYENYYVYTVKTNSAGDFMIWGIPLGQQTIHVDLDLSDIGCFSLRPYDFIKKGIGEDNFERSYSFKSSEDLDGLPQIVSFDEVITVYPFWGNEDLCEIGITRKDFDLADKDIKIEPISLILASSITDDNGDSIKRNGKIRKKSGYKCNLQTTGGKVECVRYTGNKVKSSSGTEFYPELEYFNITEVIDDDGNVMVALPMNMEYIYTNEFGEEEITNDPNKGIPTTTIARFRFSLNFEDRKIATAKYLVPNIREFNPNISSGVHSLNEYSEGMLASYMFSDLFEDYITVPKPFTGITYDSTNYGNDVKTHKKKLMLGTNNGGIPEDYFYKFIFGKVYTVSSFQGTHYETARRDAFLGIKQIRPNVEEDCAAKANYFPTNFAFRNRTKFTLLVSQVLLFIQFVYAVILLKFAEIAGSFFWAFGQALYDFYLGWPFKWRPFERLSERLKDFAYRIQDRFTQQVGLTIYPDCEECTTDDESLTSDISRSNDYCRVAEVKCKLTGVEIGPNDYFVKLTIQNTISDFSNSNIPGSTFLDDIFPNESARSTDGLCINTIPPNFSDLTNLDDQTVTIPNDPNNSKYYANVYPLVTSPGSTSFNNFLIFFNNSLSQTNYIQFQDDGTNIYIRFTNEQFNELTGLNYNEASYASGIIDTDTYAVLRIYDRSVTQTTQSVNNTLNFEQGCQKYDKLYNESITYKYLWGTSSNYGDVLDPLNPPTYTGGYEESLTTVAGKNLLSSLIGDGTTQRLPYKKIWNKIENSTYDRKTKSGLSELKDGLFTIIPVIKGKTNNLQALLEWYRRKRVGLFFCGGVVNYSFIDNWLNGLLYFFKFDKRIRWDDEEEFDLNQRGSKYPRELIFYNITDKNFYYRSTPYKYVSSIGSFIGQTYFGYRQILHPTTFYDVGVRDEFLYEICTDPRIDPTCSVIRDITNSSYQDPANIVEYAINYRLDISDAKFDVGDFFSGQQYGSNIKVFDGDIIQLMSINCEAGIEAFDLDSPHYFNYNGELLDPEDSSYGTYFKSGTNYGPTPIDLKFDFNGEFIRGCLNYRLGDYSQKVPFYLWDKGGTGFGPYGTNSDQQRWDRTSIASMKLQRIFSISNTMNTSTNYNMFDGEEEYLLRPMTTSHSTFSTQGNYEDMLERFENISMSAPTGSASGFTEGDMWLRVLTGSVKDPLTGNIYVVVNQTWTLQSQQYQKDVWETFITQTIENYTGNKQVLSTPFLFYFGLRPEKTSIDLLIKHFGPKGAFTPTD